MIEKTNLAVVLSIISMAHNVVGVSLYHCPLKGTLVSKIRS